MNIRQILEKFQIFEMAMYENPRKDFGEFRQYVLDNPKAKKTYLIWDGKVRIPSDTILHDEEEHKLTEEEWLDFLHSFDLIGQGMKGNRKPRYNGQPLKYMLQTNNYCFGCVIEYFNGDVLPILTTVFIDHPNTVKSWYQK